MRHSLLGDFYKSFNVQNLICTFQCRQSGKGTSVNLKPVDRPVKELGNQEKLQDLFQSSTTPIKEQYKVKFRASPSTEAGQDE